MVGLDRDLVRLRVEARVKQPPVLKGLRQPKTVGFAPVVRLPSLRTSFTATNWASMLALHQRALDRDR